MSHNQKPPRQTQYFTYFHSDIYTFFLALILNLQFPLLQPTANNRPLRWYFPLVVDL